MIVKITVEVEVHPELVKEEERQEYAMSYHPTPEAPFMHDKWLAEEIALNSVWFDDPQWVEDGKSVVNIGVPTITEVLP